MTGATFGAAFTAMAKAGSDVVAMPSLTRMMMFEYVPICALVGVPASWPVAVLKLAQTGMPLMENDSVLPFASLAVGRNEYPLPA
jgi:hypothetical protein